MPTSSGRWMSNPRATSYFILRTSYLPSLEPLDFRFRGGTNIRLLFGRIHNVLIQQLQRASGGGERRRLIARGKIDVREAVLRIRRVRVGDGVERHQGDRFWEILHQHVLISQLVD